MGSTALLPSGWVWRGWWRGRRSDEGGNQIAREFDVVLFLGVLYHMEHLLESLTRVRRLTREIAIIETEAVALAGMTIGLYASSFHSQRNRLTIRQTSGRPTRLPLLASASRPASAG
jgi:hypothetical protein